MSKISFRFYKDHEVRAIWDEENSKWWFSIVDIVAAITESPRPRVYWGTVKNRQKERHSQLYSRCIQLKLTSADDKKYATDCFAQEDIEAVVKTLPANKRDYLDAMIATHTTDSSRIRELLRGALTDKIDDREIFMKGIDYSYYYEQND